MKRTLLTSLALAIAAIIPLTLATANSGGAAAAATSQACGTKSKKTFSFYHTETATGGSSTEAAMNGYDEMLDLLISNSGVSCGPCEIPTACKAKADFDSTDLVLVSGPTQTSPGFWVVKWKFNGNYRVLCGKCSN